MIQGQQTMIGTVVNALDLQGIPTVFFIGCNGSRIAIKASSVDVDRFRTVGGVTNASVAVTFEGTPGDRNLLAIQEI